MDRVVIMVSVMAILLAIGGCSTLTGSAIYTYMDDEGNRYSLNRESVGSIEGVVTMADGKKWQVIGMMDNEKIVLKGERSVSEGASRVSQMFRFNGTLTEDGKIVGTREFIMTKDKAPTRRDRTDLVLKKVST